MLNATPVVPETGVSTDGTPGGRPTATLSKVEALSRAVSWLVTASPASVVVIAMLVVPIWVQVLPLADTAPVTLVPLRVSFSQTGAACVPPAM